MPLAAGRVWELASWHATSGRRQVTTKRVQAKPQASRRGEDAKGAESTPEIMWDGKERRTSETEGKKSRNGRPGIAASTAFAGFSCNRSRQVFQFPDGADGNGFFEVGGCRTARVLKWRRYIYIYIFVATPMALGMAHTFSLSSIRFFGDTDAYLFMERRRAFR